MHEEYEDTAELARRTKTSDSYWNKMRVAGEGPPFIKLGRRVLYRPNLVDEWLAAMTRSSTSEAPAERAGPGAPDLAERTVQIPPTPVTRAEARLPRSSPSRVAKAAKKAARVVGIRAAPLKQPPEAA
jgi:hypothetical protein